VKPPETKIQRRDGEICLTRPLLSGEMDSLDDDKIARLLRLKRYEQPPPGYFENFLHEFRRRQRERDELGHQSLWRRIWFERGWRSVFSHNLWPLAYSSAAMVAVVAGSVIISIKPQQQHITQLAAQSSPVSARASILGKQVEFEPASFEMQAAVLPGTSDRLLLPASDQRVPLNLEWESLDEDQPVLPGPPP
jgi:hypothetical protein